MGDKPAPAKARKQRSKHRRNALSSQSQLEEGKGGSISSTATSANDRALVAKNHKSHTNSYTWKSNSTKLANEFYRVQRLVRYVAPEQFRNPARPSNGPCRIVPTSLAEYIEHTQEILKMQAKELSRGIEVIKERAKISKQEGHAPIKSRLGQGAKVYNDGLTPVLCQPSIWSEEYKSLNIEDAAWPMQTELQECGDRRENNRIDIRCGRYFPPPRHSTYLMAFSPYTMAMFPVVQTSVFKQAFPLDEPGPIFQQGPSPMEVLDANNELNNDSTFEEDGRMWLGTGMMDIIGHWKSPFVPDWLTERN